MQNDNRDVKRIGREHKQLLREKCAGSGVKTRRRSSEKTGDGGCEAAREGNILFPAAKCTRDTALAYYFFICGCFPAAGGCDEDWAGFCGGAVGVVGDFGVVAAGETGVAGVASAEDDAVAASIVAIRVLYSRGVSTSPVDKPLLAVAVSFARPGLPDHIPFLRALALASAMRYSVSRPPNSAPDLAS